MEIMDSNDTVAAPWTDEQLQNIRTYQESGQMHPFTCTVHSDQELDVCSTHMFCKVLGCDYRQYWVHKFMTEPQFPVDAAMEFCELAFGSSGIKLDPYIVRTFLELQRNKTIDEVLERLKPWGVGMFTGWKGHNEESLITLEFAEEEFEASFEDVVQSIREMKRE